MIVDIFMALELAVIGAMVFVLMVMVGHAIDKIEIEIEESESDADHVGSGQTGQKAD